MRSPSMRAQDISIMPQLDGPASLPVRDPIGRRMQEVPRLAGMKNIPKEAHMCKEHPYQEGWNIQEEMVMMMTIEDHIEIRDPLREENIQIKVEDPLTKDDTLIEDLLQEGTPIEMEDPLEEKNTQEEDPLMEMEDSLMEMEDPLVVEDLLVMEDHLDLLVDKDHQVLKDPPGPVRPTIVQTPQVTLDTSALDNIFDSVEQSMLQLARAQDQTNRQLQQHIQQGQINMQAHTGALQQIATSTYQRNFDHIFASIPIYGGSDREGFFLGLNFWKQHTFTMEETLKQKPWVGPQDLFRM